MILAGDRWRAAPWIKSKLTRNTKSYWQPEIGGLTLNLCSRRWPHDIGVATHVNSAC
jgi:hypothetical protein